MDVTILYILHICIVYHNYVQIAWGEKVMWFLQIDWQRWKFSWETIGLAMWDYHAAMQSQCFPTNYGWVLSAITKLNHKQFAIYDIGV